MLCENKLTNLFLKNLDGETSMGLTTLLIGGLTVSLTILHTEGSEEDEGTKFEE